MKELRKTKVVHEGKDVTRPAYARLLKEAIPQTERNMAVFIHVLGYQADKAARVLGVQSIARKAAQVLKANPYHDATGAFVSRDEATSVSIGGVFDKQRENAKEREEAKAKSVESSDSDLRVREAREKLEKYIDFDAPLARIDAINRRIEELNADKQKYGYGDGKPIPLQEKPVVGKGFGGVSEEDIRKTFSAENSSVYMAMSRATLSKVLGGDNIKNSLETGKGTFKTVSEERAIKERQFLGVKADVTDVDAYPKYGFVATKGAMGDQGIVGFGYGSVYVEFRDSIRERTTVTIGDSFNNNSGDRYRIPAPIDAVGGAQFYGDSPSAEWKLAEKGMTTFNENKANGNVRDLASTAEYVEAQVYGKLERDSIARIHVESAKDAKAMEAAIKKHGLDIEVVPTKTHTVLSRLAGGYIDDWDKVSSEDLSKLGDSYLSPGWSTTGANLWAPGWKKDLANFNLPKTKAAMAKYPSAKDVPPHVMREVMMEYIAEGRKGAAGSLTKILWRKKSSRDGFTDDVLDKSLLKEYPK